ncbi:MAG: hypothetical protein R3F11_04825 [Verrucomicrobiales bacterium]
MAVLGIQKLRRAEEPRDQITGESFNDGVGVVVFLLLLGIAIGRRL